MLEQLARIVLPSEILERFEIVQIETDEEDIDSMSRPMGQFAGLDLQTCSIPYNFAGISKSLKSTFL